MSGSGSTVILPGAVASITAENEIVHVEQRELVNKGTFTHQNGQIEMAEGAILRNTGTYKSNTGYSVAIIAGSGVSSIVNTGVVEKTEDIDNTIEPPFENVGSVLVKHNTLGFAGGGTTGGSSIWKAAEGTSIEFSGGSFPMTGGTLEGAVKLTGTASMDLEGTAVASAQFEVVGATLAFPGGSAIATSATVGSGGAFRAPGRSRSRI